MVMPKKKVKQKTFIGTAEEIDKLANDFRDNVETLGTIINHYDYKLMDDDDDSGRRILSPRLACTIIYQDIIKNND